MHTADMTVAGGEVIFHSLSLPQSANSLFPLKTPVWSHEILIDTSTSMQSRRQRNF